jgi:hypothetical protein
MQNLIVILLSLHLPLIANYTFELHYFYRPASLTAAGDSGQTWISENAPIALLYACLTEAAIFLKMDPSRNSYLRPEI